MYKLLMSFKSRLKLVNDDCLQGWTNTEHAIHPMHTIELYKCGINCRLEFTVCLSMFKVKPLWDDTSFNTCTQLFFLIMIISCNTIKHYLTHACSQVFICKLSTLPCGTMYVKYTLYMLQSLFTMLYVLHTLVANESWILREFIIMSK